MSRNALIEFLQAAVAAPAMRDELKASATSPREIVEFAHDYGYHFTEKELQVELNRIFDKFPPLDIPPGAGSAEFIIDEMLNFCEAQLL
ncbi:Nif11-like leader peptide family natural product precursor [[Phormidium] sp. ETS-05]|uniref:Nif11-like leader peptide family natural product precursor n=1 Tax=[Phormidium] sp. ETS-05 TaxID=222819 RepID=UPI0018EEE26A|nr:Nif11-like leader peptide family natural product precursor [[Phormidium] sp. ETS-05]